MPITTQKIPFANDHVARSLDLHELLVDHPEATFFVRVEGDSMIEAGVYSGDILIVDRSLPAQNGKIIVAVIDGEFTVKRFDKYSTEESDFQVWGVVTYVIHRAR